jgi:chromosome segregation ATPase
MEVNKVAMGKMKRVFYNVLGLKKAHSILTQKLEMTSEALKNSVDLLKAADEKVKEIQSIAAEHEEEIKRLLVKIDNFSEHIHVVSSSMKTVSTASQASVNISDYNANSLQLAEAADKINRLEDELYKKRKCVRKLKNKLTCYRLRGDRIRGKTD